MTPPTVGTFMLTHVKALVRMYSRMHTHARKEILPYFEEKADRHQPINNDYHATESKDEIHIDLSFSHFTAVHVPCSTYLCPLTDAFHEARAHCSLLFSVVCPVPCVVSPVRCPISDTPNRYLLVELW